MTNLLINLEKSQMSNSKITKTSATKNLKLNDTYALDCILNAMQEDGLGNFEAIVDGDDKTEISASVYNLVVENLQKYTAAQSEIAGLIGDAPKDVSDVESALVNVPADDLAAAVELQSTISGKMFYAMQEIQQYAGFQMATVMSAIKEQAYLEEKARNDVQFLSNRIAEADQELQELEQLNIRNLDANKEIGSDMDALYEQLEGLKARSANFRRGVREKRIAK